MNNIKPLQLFAMALIITIFAAPASGANHALLIGIGDYNHMIDLDGPPYDVEALKSLLKSSWDFRSENIHILQDGQATKHAILKKLSVLINTSKPGDFVLIYYSGHGTSPYDPNSTSIGLDPYTGALIPVEFEKGDPEKMLQTLIVSKRDIKPALLKLEKDRRVLAIFDSCYSGDGIRGLKLRGKPRYESLNWKKDPQYLQTLSKSHSSKPPDYPYKNVIFLSASSRTETAKDIHAELLQSGVETFDGRPHGALTNFLLKGLSGLANLNGDDKITNAEMYQYLTNTVKNFDQTPQLLYNVSLQSALDESIIQVKLQPLSAENIQNEYGVAYHADNLLKIKLVDNSHEIKPIVERLEGVEVVGSDEDLVLKKTSDEYRISQIGGHMLVSYPVRETNEMIARLKTQSRVKKIVEYKFTHQDFNVFLKRLDSDGGNAYQGVIVEGEPFGFEVRSERSAYILLLDIDPLGNINVLYPFDEEEMVRLAANQPLVIQDLSLTPPYGTDFIKVFAFIKLPVELKSLLGKTFSADAPESSILLKLIENSGDDQAEAAIQVKTCSKDELKTGE